MTGVSLTQKDLIFKTSPILAETSPTWDLGSWERASRPHLLPCQRRVLERLQQERPDSVEESRYQPPLDPVSGRPLVFQQKPEK